MAFSLIPQGVYRSVYCLTGELLVEKGISLVLADLDNTLARYGQSKPDTALKARVKALHWMCPFWGMLVNQRQRDIKER